MLKVATLMVVFLAVVAVPPVVGYARPVTPGAGA